MSIFGNKNYCRFSFALSVASFFFSLFRLLYILDENSEEDEKKLQFLELHIYIYIVDLSALLSLDLKFHGKSKRKRRQQKIHQKQKF